jgi:hypothetical protein
VDAYCDEKVPHKHILYYNEMISDAMILSRKVPFTRNETKEKELVPLFPPDEDSDYVIDPKKVRVYEIDHKSTSRRGDREHDVLRLLYFEYKDRDDECTAISDNRAIVLESKHTGMYDYHSHDDVIVVGLWGAHPEIVTKRFNYGNSDGSGYFSINPDIDDPMSLLTSLMATFTLFCCNAPH